MSSFFAMLAAKKLAGGASLPVATRTLQFTVAASADGGTIDDDGNLWIASFGGGGVVKHDGISSTVLATRDSSGDYRGVGWNGTHILGAEYDDDDIYLINKDATSAGTLMAKNNPRDLEVVGGQLCLSTGGALEVYDDNIGTTLLNTWDHETDLGFGSTENSLWAVTSIGGNLCVGEEESGKIRIFDGVSTTLLREITVGSAANLRTLFHDGTYLYSGSTNGEIYRHDNG